MSIRNIRKITKVYTETLQFNKCTVMLVETQKHRRNPLKLQETPGDYLFTTSALCWVNFKVKSHWSSIFQHDFDMSRVFWAFWVLVTNSAKISSLGKISFSLLQLLTLELFLSRILWEELGRNVLNSAYRLSCIILFQNRMNQTL